MSLNLNLISAMLCVLAAAASCVTGDLADIAVCGVLAAVNLIFATVWK